MDNTHQHVYGTATHYNTLQHTAAHSTLRLPGSVSSFHTSHPIKSACCSVLQCVAMCCSVLQCVADPYSIMAFLLPSIQSPSNRVCVRKRVRERELLPCTNVHRRRCCPDLSFPQYTLKKGCFSSTNGASFIRVQFLASLQEQSTL